MIRATLRKDGFDGESRWGRLLFYVRRDVSLTLNNLLSTYYVPGIVLKAGNAKRTRDFSVWPRGTHKWLK